MAVRIESQAEPIPGYTLIERIGGGGFGEVWKAVAPGGLLKAIKFVYGDLQTSSEAGQRAEQELKALSRVKTVRHPYILSLERYDIVDGRLIIVMELADRNLWDRFRECRAEGLPGIPREELLAYMVESAEALDLMNGQYQLQHLDIKPQNLFLVHNHAKIADFGLVKDLEGRIASVTGGVTPVYAAPETFDGWVSRFSDQYSLAIVYQELLTGQRPFDGTSARQLITQHLHARPFLDPLSPGDREAIGRALAKKPDNRFPSCFELVQALRGDNGQAAVGGSAPTSKSGLRTRPPQLRVPEQSPADANPQRIDTPGSTRSEKASSDASPGGDTPSIRGLADVETDEQPETVLRPTAAEEILGDGLLFPALVIGLGDLGLRVLQELRENLNERAETPEVLSNIRLVYLDTDPKSLSAATQNKCAPALNDSDVLIAKLSRPSHYLRSKNERARIDSWIDPKMLYRIPRSLSTGGLRPLGRLAFLDNFHAIRKRLRRELEACIAPDNLAAAAENSGLGLRSNRPRVYVLTGLGGGTGSGMFIDLAYVIRSLLREIGFHNPEVIGILFLPAVDRSAGNTFALGNAFAALTELNHFSSPGAVFSAHYDDKDSPLVDSQPPFSRCVLIPLPEGKGDAASREKVCLTADYLCGTLTTALGRLADESRAGQEVGSPPSVAYQSFGVRRISWPRRKLVRDVGRGLCQCLVERWMSKDAAPLREKVSASTATFWADDHLADEHLMARLHKACENALGAGADARFTAVTASLANLEAQETTAILATARNVLAQIEDIIGRPNETGELPAGVLAEPLRATVEEVVAGWGEKLTQFAVQMIERPEFRLAGAEEALRQIIAIIEQVLEHSESLSKELSVRSKDARAQIDRLIGDIQATAASPTRNRRSIQNITNLSELLRVYPRWAYQSLVLQCVISTYLSLRGQLADHLLDLNSCRGRLGELKQDLGDTDSLAHLENELTYERVIFPGGPQTLNGASLTLLQSISGPDLETLDGQMQELLQQQFTSLAHVCLMTSHLPRNLRSAMQRQAEAFVESRLAGLDVTNTYLTLQSDEEQAKKELLQLFELASPALVSPRRSSQAEICILTTPDDSCGERLRDLTRQAVPEVNWVTGASGGDDIVFYRECSQISLSELEQLGPLGLEAYRQMAALQHFTPHSRSDINEWRSASA
jgi:serine/threonine protein kinase